MKKPGFTIVELAIVLVVMSILLTLAVVNVRSSQVRARDSERHADVQAIANTLESYRSQSHENNTIINTYPQLLLQSGGTSAVHPTAATFITEKSDQSALIPPESTSPSLVAAQSSSQNATSVQPQPTTSTYVYQPLTADGGLCTAHGGDPTPLCTRFNIYYKLEQPTDECPATQDNICVKRSQR